MSCLALFNSAKAHHGWAQRTDEEHPAPLPGGAALLLPDYRQAVLCSRLCQWWRGEFPSHIALKKKKVTSLGVFHVHDRRLLHSSSTISRGRGSSWSPEPGSMLPKLQAHWATSTPCTLSTGNKQPCSAPVWLSAVITSASNPFTRIARPVTL